MMPATTRVEWECDPYLRAPTSGPTVPQHVRYRTESAHALRHHEAAEYHPSAVLLSGATARSHHVACKSISLDPVRRRAVRIAGTRGGDAGIEGRSLLRAGSRCNPVPSRNDGDRKRHRS